MVSGNTVKSTQSTTIAGAATSKPTLAASKAQPAKTGVSKPTPAATSAKQGSGAS